MRYISLNTLNHDEIKINKMIKDGWKPQGGLQIVRDSYNIEKFYQAMVKE